jgi:hypothetical protein
VPRLARIVRRRREYALRPRHGDAGDRVGDDADEKDTHREAASAPKPVGKDSEPLCPSFGHRHGVAAPRKRAMLRPEKLGNRPRGPAVTPLWG